MLSTVNRACKGESPGIRLLPPSASEVASSSQAVTYLVTMDDGSKGSATFVGDGLFMTAAHVVGLSQRGTLSKAAERWPFDVRAADFDRDLALLYSRTYPSTRALP